MIEREAPGLAEAMRLISPFGRLSRGVAGVRGQAIVCNTPGSPKGCVEQLGAVLDVLPHALRLLHERRRRTERGADVAAPGLATLTYGWVIDTTRPPFELVLEIDPPTRPSLVRARHQIGVLGTVADRFLVPDNHLGRATVSSIAVAREVAAMGGRAIACLNSRDRNVLGFRRDLLTAAAYGVDSFLLVYGDRPDLGRRSDDVSVRRMMEEIRTFGSSDVFAGCPPFEIGVTTRLTAVARSSTRPTSSSPRSATRSTTSPGGGTTAAFDGPVYAGVMVVASAAMARKLGRREPAADRAAVADRRRRRRPVAGVDAACALDRRRARARRVRRRPRRRRRPLPPGRRPAGSVGWGENRRAGAGRRPIASGAVLRLVLPKGSLEQATLELFEAADLAVVRSSAVEYKASIDDPRVAEVRILRPQEIPIYVAEGLFDLGITGPRLDRGDAQRRRQPRRAALLQGHDRTRSAWWSPWPATRRSSAPPTSPTACGCRPSTPS